MSLVVKLDRDSLEDKMSDTFEIYTPKGEKYIIKLLIDSR